MPHVTLQTQIFVRLALNFILLPYHRSLASLSASLIALIVQVTLFVCPVPLTTISIAIINAPFAIMFLNASTATPHPALRVPRAFILIMGYVMRVPSIVLFAHQPLIARRSTPNSQLALSWFRTAVRLLLLTVIQGAMSAKARTLCFASLVRPGSTLG